jgi:amidase
LSEWAAFRSLNAPNGFSARGGQGKVSKRGVWYSS